MTSHLQRDHRQFKIHHDIPNVKTNDKQQKVEAELENQVSRATFVFLN